MNHIPGSDFSNQTDGQLLARFDSLGDQRAFAELIRRHGAMVLKICRRLAGGDVHAADDASQQVFVTLASRAKPLTTRTSIAGWLYRAAWHVMSRGRRQGTVRATYERAAAEHRAADTSIPDDSVPFAVMTSELSDALARAIATLPESYRDAVVLHHFGGHTVEETARILDVKMGTAASWLSRSRAILRDRLDGFGAVVSADALAIWLYNERVDRASRTSSLACDERRDFERFQSAVQQELSATAGSAAPVIASTAAAGALPLRAGIAAMFMMAVAGTTMAAGGPTAALSSIASAALRVSTAKPPEPEAKTESTKSKDDRDKEFFSFEVWASNDVTTRNSGFGRSSPIPEPSTGAMLLGIGAWILASRRRRS